MDTDRFDTLVKQLYTLTTRRKGLRVLLAGLAAGALGFPAVTEAADCGGKDAPCDKNGDCCSGQCLFPGFRQRDDGQAGQESRAGQQRIAAAKRGKKGKKSRKCRKGNKGRLMSDRQENCKGDKKGKCLCSRLQERCNKASDCCFGDQTCEDNGCDEHEGHTVCCKKQGDPCEDDCDCCGDNECDEDTGTCQPCKDAQEECLNSAECCHGLICDKNADGCGRPADKNVCCGIQGGPCEEDCDCCGASKCDSELGECYSPGSLCPPDEVACLIPNPKKPCCPGGFPHCCHEDKPFGCCLEGFPVCCDHTKVIVVNGQTLEVGCCQDGQVCCPREAEILCANSLAECGVT